jgi:hypothetical protein
MEQSPKPLSYRWSGPLLFVLFSDMGELRKVESLHVWSCYPDFGPHMQAGMEVLFGFAVRFEDCWDELWDC